MQNDFNFKDKNVLVTGAGSGLGRATAMEFAKRGAFVAMLGRRLEKIKETQKIIESAGGKGCSMVCDVSDSQSVSSVLNQLLSHVKHIDILVNAAGITSEFSIENIEDEKSKWQEQIEVNLSGTAYMCGHIIKHMLERGQGRIINIASVNAFFTSKTVARHSYNASKAGVCGLTKGLSSSYAKNGITINAVCPGLFESEMTKTLIKNKYIMATFNKQVPIARPGKVEEIVGPILFLASDLASYVTGQCILVDGGMTTGSYL